VTFSGGLAFVLTRGFHVVIILYTYHFTAAVQTASYMASIILLSVAAGKTPTHNNILLYSGVYDGVRVPIYLPDSVRFHRFLWLLAVFFGMTVMLCIKYGSTTETVFGWD